MENIYITSRKTIRSVSNLMNILESGNFTEIEVKALMIDLRDLAKHFRQKSADEINHLNEAIEQFADLCDFLTHPFRKSGYTEEMISAHLKTLYGMKDFSIKTIEKMPFSQTINIEKLVVTMIAFAEITLKGAENVKGMNPKFNDLIPDITLCMMSLIQDATIKFKKDHGYGTLHLMPYKGFYRVYCRIIGTKIEKEATVNQGFPNKVVFGFPVFVSNIPCNNTGVLSCNFNQDFPPLFETYRDQEQKLQLRTFDYGSSL